MNFETYATTHICTPLETTEQSWAFLVAHESTQRVCKRYPNPIDRCKEELAYSYITKRNILQIPRIFSSGEDFLEMEYIPKESDATLDEKVAAITKLYLHTNGISHPKGYFPKIDLSQEKLQKRLEYLPAELEKRGVWEDKLIAASRAFTKKRYIQPNYSCLIHGDLKTPHIIKNRNGIYFIDLALASIATPWYDLAFLFMEQKEKTGMVDALVKASEEITASFTTKPSKVKEYILSAIFYRTLYDVGFAARHRPDKTLRRTLNELKEIVEGRIV